MEQQVIKAYDEMIEEQKKIACPEGSSAFHDYVREIFRERYELIIPGAFLKTPRQALLAKFPDAINHSSQLKEARALFEIGELRKFIKNRFAQADQMDAVDKTLEYIRKQDVALFNIATAKPLQNH